MKNTLKYILLTTLIGSSYASIEIKPKNSENTIVNNNTDKATQTISPRSTVNSNNTY